MSISNGSGFFGKMRNNLTTERYPDETVEAKTKIKVIVRIRPYLDLDSHSLHPHPRALTNTSGSMHVDTATNNIHLDSDQKNKHSKQFHFDLIADGSTSQADLYESAHIREMVKKVVDGYHSTIFAYG